MVIGVTVRDPAPAPAAPADASHPSPRKLTLVMQRAPGQDGDVARQPDSC